MVPTQRSCPTRVPPRRITRLINIHILQAPPTLHQRIMIPPPATEKVGARLLILIKVMVTKAVETRTTGEVQRSTTMKVAVIIQEKSPNGAILAINAPCLNWCFKKGEINVKRFFILVCSNRKYSCLKSNTRSDKKYTLLGGFFFISF